MGLLKSLGFYRKIMGDNLVVLEVPNLLAPGNWHKYAAARWWNDLYLYLIIKAIMRRYSNGNPVIIGVGHPRYPFRKLKATVKYYDCMDNFAAFPESDAWMHLREREVEKYADCIFVRSERLKELFPARQDVIVVNNGVNPNDFKVPTPFPPSDLPTGKPIMGYYGTISSWFDYKTVLYAAQRCPEYNFILIGPANPDFSSNLKEVIKESNVFWLNEKPYKQLKNYLVFFDVALIPFQVNELTKYVNPTKIYEYFCMGKPVLCAPLPPILRYEPHIKVYHDADEFVNLLRKIIVNQPDPGPLRRIALANTWEHRAQQIRLTLEKTLKSKIGDSS
jgi:glycosyltransferase involved in cell wall biosynthesis